jgi:AGCS family alanine or glycine:cation symporter
MALLEALLGGLKTLLLTLNDLIWNWPQAFPTLVALLLGTGVVTTLRLKFVQIRHFGHGFRVLKGDFDDPRHKGELTHFQALSTALSATVGIGNIAGVATAIHYGGPGAMFWMWVTAVLGMALKYTEVTLAQRYRVVTPSGDVAGGPMYSIERGLGPKWKPLAVAFAAFTVISSFGSGNAVQAFTVADQFRQDLHIPTWATGLLCAGLVAAVILGGIRRIGAVTQVLSPLMCGLYVAGGLLVLLLHWNLILPTFGQILVSAFQPAAAVGGFSGAGLVFLLTWGVKRGLFSNESGQGSAPIAHSAARTDEPVREGMVALLEPFIDTLVVCSMTGLVVVMSGLWHEKQEQTLPLNRQSNLRAVAGEVRLGPNGVLASGAPAAGAFPVEEGRPQGFTVIRNQGTVEEARLLVGGRDFLGPSPGPFSGTVVFSPAAPGDLVSAVFTWKDGRREEAARLWLRGLALQNGSPLSSWAFEKGLSPLFPGGRFIVTLGVFLFAVSTAISWSYYGDRAITYLFGERWIFPYRVVFCLVHFLGAIYSLELVWTFGDTALGLMSLPNLLAILLLTGQVRTMTEAYVREGKMVPPRRSP